MREGSARGGVLRGRRRLWAPIPPTQAPLEGSRRLGRAPMRRCRAQDTGAKECGLHSGNMVAAAAEQAAGEQQRDLWVGGAVEALSREQVASLLGGPRDRATLVAFYAPWCPFSQARADPHRCAPSAAGGLPGGDARRTRMQGTHAGVPAALDRFTHADIALNTCHACRA